MSDPMEIGSVGTARCDKFRQYVMAIDQPRVLEIGTLRWENDRPTHHQDWVQHAAKYVMTDVKAGTDVDVVSDAHDLKEFENEYFDIVIAVSVFEHLRRPWRAAEAIYRVMRRSGLLYVGTHQTFPLHGYPHDYFRFSAPALAGMFEDVGFSWSEAGYTYPCKITPPKEVTRWNEAAESYLNVDIFAIR